MFDAAEFAMDIEQLGTCVIGGVCTVGDEAEFIMSKITSGEVVYFTDVCVVQPHGGEKTLYVLPGGTPLTVVADMLTMALGMVNKLLGGNEKVM